MSKTLTNLITEASTLTDETYDNQKWVEWFNHGIDDISEVANIEGSTTLTSVGGVFTLPEDYISVIMMTGDSGALSRVEIPDTTSTGYKIIGNTFTLQNDTSASVVLVYYKRPAYLSTTQAGTAIDLPYMFLRALVLFGCKESMLSEDEPERYQLFSNEYERAKLSVLKASKKKKGLGSSGQWSVQR